MLKKLCNIIVSNNVKRAKHLPDNRFDKYGFTFLGLYKPLDYEDDYMYTHTRAVFYTKDTSKNLAYPIFRSYAEPKHIAEIKVGRSFLKFSKFRKYNSIVDLILQAIEYNKMGRLTTIEQILRDIPTSLYENEEVTDKIINSIMEYPYLLEEFLKIKEIKLKAIDVYNLQMEQQEDDKQQ